MQPGEYEGRGKWKSEVIGIEVSNMHGVGDFGIIGPGHPDFPAAKAALDALVEAESGEKRTRDSNGKYADESPMHRFWAKVSLPENLDDCWVWIGAEFGKGYGGFWLENDWWRAHRAAWYLFRGPIPDGTMVCHSCDNRKCVNPSHLFLGDGADNMQDCATKGRIAAQVHPETAARGEGCAAAKLTETDVVEMRERYAQGGVSQRELANNYGVAQSTIMRALRGESWSHVDAPAEPSGEWVEWTAKDSDWGGNFKYRAKRDGSVVEWANPDRDDWTDDCGTDAAAYRKGREVALEQTRELVEAIGTMEALRRLPIREYDRLHDLARALKDGGEG